MSVKDELIEYYSRHSKHSNYQVLPTKLKSIIGESPLDIKSRHEKERLDYILNKLDVRDKSVLDIGANTGYFSFELLEAGAKSVTCYEGNQEHAKFIELAAAALELQGAVKVVKDYYLFDNKNAEHYDIGLLLNILHHVGDDYGDRNLSVAAAKSQILEQLNSMAAVSRYMVFQLGFNWQGDTSKPLFEHGTKKEVIDFIKGGLKDWNAMSIGIAEKNDDKIKYQELNDSNIERDDSLGEFLNRPLFILKSKVSA
jgi:SAM-dependent methyltransferase